MRKITLKKKRLFFRMEVCTDESRSGETKKWESHLFAMYLTCRFNLV